MAVPSYRREKEYRDLIMQALTQPKDFFADERKVNKAINLFKKGVEIDPNYPDNYAYIYLTYVRQQNYDEALKWLMKIPIANAVSDDFGKYLMYDHLKRLRGVPFTHNHEEIREEIDKLMDELKKTNPEILLTPDDSGMKSWVESDIIEMIRIIRKRNIKIILQTYPYRIKTHGYRLTELTDILHDVAVRFKIPLVDNEKIFQEIKGKGATDNEEYFVADGHCNSRGYKLMAVNVYNKIIEAGMLNMPHVEN